MYKCFICFLLLTFSLNFAVCELQNIKSEKTYKVEFDHDWMDKRIKNELEGIPLSSIKKEDLDKVLVFLKNLGRDPYHILKITILNNVPNFEVGVEATRDVPGTPIVMNIFNTLCRKYKLPDMELIFSMSDELDCLPESRSNSYGDAENLDVPIFVFAKNKNCKNRILFPDTEAFTGDELILNCDFAKKKYEWNSKKPRVFFRGSTSNKLVTIENFQENPRFYIVYLSRQYPRFIDAAFTSVSQEYKTFPFAASFRTSLAVPMEKHFAYKYLIDIDGNSCAYSRTRWIMLSNSVLLKCESDNIQWYYDLLKPYENYIPIKKDFSDLLTQVEWLKKHDEEAREISRKASSLGKEIFTTEAAELYTIKLLSEYAKLLR